MIIAFLKSVHYWACQFAGLYVLCPALCIPTGVVIFLMICIVRRARNDPMGQ
jgi:hypothetical protein